MNTNEIVAKIVADNTLFDQAMKQSVRELARFDAQGQNTGKVVQETAQIFNAAVTQVTRFNAAGKQVGSSLQVVDQSMKMAAAAAKELARQQSEAEKAAKAMTRAQDLATRQAEKLARTQEKEANAAVREMVRQYQQAAKEAAKATEAEAKFQDQLTRRKNAIAATQQKQTDQNTIKASTLDAITSAAAVATAAVAGTYAAFSKLMDMAQSGAQIKTVEEFFLNSGKALSKYREAAKGLISDSELMKKANLADSMGLTEATFMRLTKVAQAASLKTGQSFEYMFDSIITGTARSSKLLLDNLGIIVSVESANNKYAASLGRTVESLTDEEKKIAFTNELFIQSQGQLAELEKITGNATVGFQRMNTALDNLKDSLKVLLAEKGGLFQNLATSIGGLAQDLADSAKNGWTSLGESLAAAMGLGFLKVMKKLPLGTMFIDTTDSENFARDVIDSNAIAGRSKQKKKETDAQDSVKNKAISGFTALQPMFEQVLGKKYPEFNMDLGDSMLKDFNSALTEGSDELRALYTMTSDELNQLSPSLKNAVAALKLYIKNLGIATPAMAKTATEAEILKEEAKKERGQTKADSAAKREHKAGWLSANDLIRQWQDDATEAKAAKDAAIEHAYAAFRKQQKDLIKQHRLTPKLSGIQTPDDENAPFKTKLQKEINKAEEDHQKERAQEQKDHYASLSDVEKAWYLANTDLAKDGINKAKEARELTVKFAKQMADAIKEAGAFVAGMVNALGDMFNGILSSLMEGKSFVGSLVSQMSSTLADTISGLSKGLGSLMNAVGDALGATTFGVSIIVGSILGAITESAGAIIGAGVNQAGKAIGSAVTAFEENSTGNKDAFDNQQKGKGKSVAREWGFQDVLKTFQVGFSMVFKELSDIIGSDTFRAAMQIVGDALNSMAAAVKNLDPEIKAVLQQEFLTAVKQLAGAMIELFKATDNGRQIVQVFIAGIQLAATIINIVSAALSAFQFIIANLDKVMGVGLALAIGAALFPILLTILTPVLSIVAGLAAVYAVAVGGFFLLIDAVGLLVYAFEGLRNFISDMMGWGKGDHNNSDSIWNSSKEMKQQQADFLGSIAKSAQDALGLKGQAGVPTVAIDPKTLEDLVNNDGKNKDLQENTAALKDLAREFRNLPSGYKIAASIYGATNPGSPMSSRGAYDTGDLWGSATESDSDSLPVGTKNGTAQQRAWARQNPRNNQRTRF